MPFYMQPMAWLTFFRFGFEATLVAIYGFGR